jgi:hypothetical protein
MDASDLIKALQTPCEEGVVHIWKIMPENTVNNVYSPTFNIFTEKIRTFFADTFPKSAHLWIDRLTDNFRPLSSPLDHQLLMCEGYINGTEPNPVRFKCGKHAMGCRGGALVEDRD